jgi:hypothetical protein
MSDEDNMKRIIRHEGPKATDYALALEAWREKYSHVDFSTLSDQESQAMHDEMPATDFHDTKYEDTINYALSRRSLSLLEQLAELGIYGDSSAEVGARFVDHALREFVERNMAPPMSSEERNAIMGHKMTSEQLVALQLPKIDFHDGRYEETINDSLSTQSLYLLDRLAELELYGETSAGVGGRFVDQALREFVEHPRFVVKRTEQ